ncbi:hypothetical protein CLOM_g9686 [Closterium sp. NIES-68]|nr:hypothetical protein CLOM_g9686 [Closterium sp. NIES-68]GJP58535.1 hypothetical protein CLOP_g390 [Closterium sp. NIES-67]
MTRPKQQHSELAESASCARETLERDMRRSELMEAESTAIGEAECTATGEPEMEQQQRLRCTEMVKSERLGARMWGEQSEMWDSGG